MIKTTKSFDTAYKSLNAQQRQAVDTIEGPVMLVAGPGTGKTQTLAVRIANILCKSDASPSSILALTFTDAAATNMRTRLFTMIGEDAYKVTICTFHRFCNDLIKDNVDIFEIPAHHESLTELAKYKLIEDLLLSTGATKLRPINAPSLYVSEIIRSLSDLKREGVSPESYLEIIEKENVWLENNIGDLKKIELTKKQSDLAKNQELAKIYFAYQNYLSDHNTFDFEDMINLVNIRFEKDPNFLATYQEIYQYFLIDEYQDTNNSQNRVVENLASHWGGNANVFVVGDSNQSIMRFQGASLANTLSFLKKYPIATHIKLIENYRSPQNILDRAYSLISHNPTSFQLTELKANTNSIGSLKVIESPFESDELHYIRSSILDLIKSGVKESQVAVIYHNNHDGESLARIFRQSNISYRLGHGGNLFDDLYIKQFIKMIQVIDNLRSAKDDLDLFTILNYPWFNLSTLDVLTYSRAATTSKSTLFDIISSTAIGQKLISYVSYASNHNLIDFVDYVLNDSGMMNYLLSLPNNHVYLARFYKLFDIVKDSNQKARDITLSSFLSDLRLMHLHGLKVEDVSMASSGESLTLTTAHSAKGLEWDYVYIYKCIDGLWGNRRVSRLINLPESVVPEAATLKAEKNEDERRLFYVAMTRARTSLTITYSLQYQQNGKYKSVMPSMFISEIGNHLQKEHYQSQEFDLSPANIVSERVESDEKSFLSELLSDSRLSVTALNNYLKCGYYFKLQNLIKVPSSKASYLSLGTAIHATLAWLYKTMQNDEDVTSLNEVLIRFKIELDKELLSDTDAKLRLDQGKKILSSYYNFHKDQLGSSIFIEKFFGYGPNKILLEDIPLTGATDREELISLNDKTIKVIDYKTGKPKTFKEIEASDYKRQLVFYKLLIDLDKSIKYKVEEAELDFIESPFLTGKSGKRSFKITEKEVENLIKEVKNSMKNIRKLHFPRTTDKTVCAKCPFLDHCYPTGLS